MSAALAPDRLCMGCMAAREGVTCVHCGYVDGTGPESPLHLPPGIILRDQFLLGRVLGSGGFGITYLGYDLELGVKLAVKEYLPAPVAFRSPGQTRVTPHLGSKKESFQHGLDSFVEEGRTLARFRDHPGIVSVMSFFRENGTAYLVMSFIEGMTFGELLEGSGGALPFEKALKVLMPVMDALRAVHAERLLHRDISPDNIYLTASRQVKLMDFGTAKEVVAEESKSLSVVLKHGYAPVEQYSSRGRQGPWTDVYALGATLYRAITGQVPPDSLDRAHGPDELVPPSALGVAIPAAAESALLKALAVRAQDRWQSVRELQDALLASVPFTSKDRPPAPPPLPPGPSQPVLPVDASQPVKPRREGRLRYALLAGASAALVLAALGVVGYFGIRALRAKPRVVVGRTWQDTRSFGSGNGQAFHVSFELTGAKGRQMTLLLRCLTDDAQRRLVTANERSSYRLADGALGSGQRFVPLSNHEKYGDAVLALPAAEFPSDIPGEHAYRCAMELFADTERVAVLGDYPVRITTNAPNGPPPWRSRSRP